MASKFLSRWRVFAYVFAAGSAFNCLIAQLFELPSRFGKYSLAAKLWLSGELDSERLFDFSPFLFHLSVVAVRWLPRPQVWLEAAQLVAAAWFLAMVFVLVDHRFGRRWAFAAAAISAFDRRLLVYQRIIEPDIWLLAAVTSTAVLIVLRRSPAAIGFWAALSLTIRPTLLPLIILVPLYFVLQKRRGATFVFLVPVLLAFGLLTARTFLIGGRLWTPVMNPGTVFFEGNNPLSHGTSAVYPPTVLSLVVQQGGSKPDSAHQHYREVARAGEKQALTIGEVNEFWAARARRFLHDHPDQLFARLREKLVRAGHGFRWHDVPSALKYDQSLLLPSIPFALLVALALCGAISEVRRWRQYLAVYCIGAFQIVVLVVFYVSARQQLQLLPAVVFFSTAACHWMSRNRRSAPLVLMMAGLVSVPFFSSDDAIEDEIYRRRGVRGFTPRFAEIRARLDAEPMASLADLLVNAYAEAPHLVERTRPLYFPSEAGLLDNRLAAVLDRQNQANPPARFDRALLLLRIGRAAAAEDELRQLVATGYSMYRQAFLSSEPLFHLARVAAERGQQERAHTLLAQALGQAPGNPFILAEQIALDDDQKAQQLLTRYWSPVDAQFLTGKALLAHGRDTEAAAAFSFVVRRLPEMRDANLYLAAALASSGSLDRAVRHFLIAAKTHSEPVLEPARLATLFRRLANESPNAEAQLLAAQVLHQLGWYSEAQGILDRMAPIAGWGEAVASERRRLETSIAALDTDIKSPTAD